MLGEKGMGRGKKNISSKISLQLLCAIGFLLMSGQPCYVGTWSKHMIEYLRSK